MSCGQKYHWVARYNDGTELKQGNGTYYDIEQSKLTEVCWIPTRKNRAAVVQHIDPTWQKPILRIRVGLEWNLRTGKKHEKFNVYMIGWSGERNGAVFKNINYIMPDGTIHNSDNYEEGVEKWMS